MAEPHCSSDCVAPGHQAVLFHLDIAAPLTFVVIDADGDSQVRTRSLGVAISVAARLVVEHGEAWISATDGCTARLEPDRVSSDAPGRPWVRTAASIHPKGH